MPHIPEISWDEELERLSETASARGIEVEELAGLVQHLHGPAWSAGSHARRLRRLSTVESLWAFVKHDVPNITPFPGASGYRVSEISPTVVVIVGQLAERWEEALMAKAESMGVKDTSLVGTIALGEREIKKMAGDAQTFAQNFDQLAARAAEKACCLLRQNLELPQNLFLIPVHLLVELRYLQYLSVVKFCQTLAETLQGFHSVPEVVLQSCDARDVGVSSRGGARPAPALRSEWLREQMGSAGGGLPVDMWFHLSNSESEHLTDATTDFVLMYAVLPDLRDQIRESVPARALWPRGDSLERWITLGSYGIARLNEGIPLDDRITATHFWEAARPMWRGRDQCYYTEREEIAFVLSDAVLSLPPHPPGLRVVPCKHSPRLLRMHLGMSPYHFKNLVGE